MRRTKELTLFLVGIFSLLIVFLMNSQTTYAAAGSPISASDFNDGISNWQNSSSSQVAQLPINGNTLRLGYAFGLAQSTTGKVTTGDDSSVTYDSISAGVNVNYSKINIFLNNNGNYISSVFQGGSNNDQTNQLNVSSTSPDFMIVPSNSTPLAGIGPAAYSVLGNPQNYGSTGNAGLQNKKFYYSTDKNGNPAYKIMGNFTRKSNSGYKNGNYDMEVEILLRASPTNSAIVQREMYVKNTDSVDAEFVTLYGEDTKLGSGYGANNDKVPVFDLGNGNGLYILDDYSGANYRLMVTNQMPDGFDDYMGQTTSSNWVSAFSDGKITGSGAANPVNPPNYKFTGNTDSSYTLKWNSTTLKPGETAHFGSTMGVTAKPYSIPTPTKTYTNETRSDGTNKVGDTLKFTLHMVNNGYGAQWNSQEITDEIPKGLQIDTSSITRSSNGVEASKPAATDYDDSTRTLTIPMPFQLTDDQYETVTFKATLTSDALQNLDSDGNMTNTAKFLGSDYKVSPNKVDTYSASTSFPVAAPDYNYSFIKKVKNITNGEDYKESTTAKPGDKIGYDIIYKVQDGSKDHMLSASTMNDVYPAGLTLDKDSITVKPGDNPEYQQTWGINTGAIHELKSGQQIEMKFEATVNSSAVGTLTNNAYITDVKTSGNQTFDKTLSSNADIDVQKVDGFTQTPTTIDFGSTNMYGKEKILNNVSTDGELIVSHPDSNPFTVNVSYNNDSDDLKLVNGNGDTIPTDGNGILFIRQRNNSFNDQGTWQPILPTGTPIQTTPFDGNQASLNLTNYIGVNDWQLKLDPRTKDGFYRGTLIWTLGESL